MIWGEIFVVLILIKDIFQLQQIMSIERQLRGKRSTFTINLIETPHGYSLVQGTELLNKVEGQPNIVQQLQPNTASSHQQNYSAPSKDYKPVYKKTNLLFLRNKQTSITNVQAANNEQMATPAYCKVFAPWFDLDSLHNIEKKEVSQWFCQKFKVTAEEADQKEQVEEWLKLYHKHRNFIVKLYIEEFAQNQKYLSANTIRKYLSHDAFWVMKLHLFLSSLGIINTHNPNFAFESKTYTHILKTRKDGKKQLLPHQLKTNIHNETDDQDQSQLLKKITAKIRPYCDFCRIHCGIVWFQHNRSLDPKEIANIMKNVNSKNPPLSQKEYEYILCVKCYCEGHFPLLLTHHDFKKISINDKLDPGRKKKNKRRRKEKKPKEGEEIEDQAKEVEQERSHVEEEEEGDKKEEINAMITKLINGIEQHQWSLQQTNLLLELIQKYGEDWITIHQQLKKKGFTKSLQTEEIILYFLSLPRRNIGKLKEQYQNDQFIESNLSANKTNVGDRLAELKLNNAIQFAQKCTPTLLKEITQIASKNDYAWKSPLEELVRFQKKKIENRLNYLFECQNLVKLIKLQEKVV